MALAGRPANVSTRHIVGFATQSGEHPRVIVLYTPKLLGEHCTGISFV